MVDIYAVARPSMGIGQLYLEANHAAPPELTAIGAHMKKASPLTGFQRFQANFLVYSLIRIKHNVADRDLKHNSSEWQFYA
ncbi:hypothetical protein [Pollutimonas nitritireducens]|nr:hypothetical protein [Pollutimonas nitritireducens]